MIPQASITAWSAQAPWPTEEQVEQDLLLSRLIIEIATHPLLGAELALRGGTCFHKLVLPRPWRYSEDLDYVRTRDGPIGPVLDGLREVASDLEMSAKTVVGRHPKVHLLGEYESGIGALRVKIEMNTFERSPHRAHVMFDHRVESAWWSGGAAVLSFEPDELVATKIRALHQRRKGRDLFDMWLALGELGLDPDGIVACFAPYRPETFSGALAARTLAGHLDDEGFRRDLEPLVIQPPGGYDVDVAAALYRSEILARLH